MNAKDAATAYRLIAKGFSILADAIDTAAPSIGAQEAADTGRAVVAPARPDTEPEWLPPLEAEEAAYKANPIQTPIDEGLPRVAKPATKLADQPPQGSLSQCPKHKIPFKDGKFGSFCPAQDDEPNWSNAKGYCSITPKNVDVWLRQHSGVPA